MATVCLHSHRTRRAAQRCCAVRSSPGRDQSPWCSGSFVGRAEPSSIKGEGRGRIARAEPYEAIHRQRPSDAVRAGERGNEHSEVPWRQCFVWRQPKEHTMQVRVQPYELDDADIALRDLAEDRVTGAAVLLPYFRTTAAPAIAPPCRPPHPEPRKTNHRGVRPGPADSRRRFRASDRRPPGRRRRR